MNDEMRQETEIDLLYLIQIILRKWYWVVGAVLLFFTLATIYAYTRLDNEYTAESSMIVQVSTQTDTSGYQDLLYGQRLVDTYAEIAKSNNVLDQVRNNLDLEYTNTQLRDMISVNSVNDTLLVKIAVVSSDPDKSADIATEVVSVVQDLTVEYEGLERVEVLDVAKVPTSPSGPNRLLYVAVGILLGGMLGVGGVLAVEFLDKNIKKPSDVEKILGIRLLGAIPFYDIEEEGEDNE